MTLVHLLRNVSVGDLVHALERDGFEFYPRARESGRMYRYSYGRQVLIHEHRSSQTLPLGTLGNILAGTRWTENDARRLHLIR